MYKRYSLLGASSITSHVGCLPARSIVDTEWEEPGKVVIAVAGLADTAVATNDDVGLQGTVAFGGSTESSIRVLLGTGEFTGGGVAALVSFAT